MSTAAHWATNFHACFPHRSRTHQSVVPAEIAATDSLRTGVPCIGGITLGSGGACRLRNGLNRIAIANGTDHRWLFRPPIRCIPFPRFWLLLATFYLRQAAGLHCNIAQLNVENGITATITYPLPAYDVYGSISGAVKIYFCWWSSHQVRRAAVCLFCPTVC